MSFKTLALIVLGALTAAVPGCSDGGEQHHEADAAPVNCATETRADDYVAGLQKVGANGVKVVLVESTPAPPAKGDNTWHVRVVDTNDAPMDGLTVQVTPFMPDHGHGTPINAEVSPIADTAGEYQIMPVNLSMPGLWEVTIAVDDGAGVTDSVVFNFCIEG